MLTDQKIKALKSKEKQYKVSDENIMDKSGQKNSVILPIEEYEELLEDLKDLATVAELKDEPTIPLDEVIAKLKANLAMTQTQVKTR